jgi:hypothetical protein
MGSVGLFVFAWVICKLAPTHQPYLVIAAATVCWMIVSLLIWDLRKRM